MGFANPAGLKRRTECAVPDRSRKSNGEDEPKGLQLLLYEQPLAVAIAQVKLGDRNIFRSRSIGRPDASQVLEPFSDDPDAPGTQLGATRL